MRNRSLSGLDVLMLRYVVPSYPTLSLTSEMSRRVKDKLRRIFSPCIPRPDSPPNVEASPSGAPLFLPEIANKLNEAFKGKKLPEAKDGAPPDSAPQTDPRDPLSDERRTYLPPIPHLHGL